jgi:hypothetical protein
MITKTTNKSYYFWLGDEGLENFSQVGEDPLDSQIGGRHYKQYPVQPIEYAMANNLNYCQANAIKYITRYRDKGGKEDLLKAIHNIQILIALEYGNNDAGNESVQP